MSATRRDDSSVVEAAQSGHDTKDPLAAPMGSANTARPTFDALYDQHFHFVWRCLRRLGVAERHMDDACQAVFLVVHRRLAEYEPRIAPRAWLFAIARRVASDFRRTETRKGGGTPLSDDQPSHNDSPLDGAIKAQAANIILRFLDTLPEPQREAFVLSELEQMTAPEISAAIDANLSTVYSRVQAARAALERYVKRHHPDLVSKLRSP